MIKLIATDVDGTLVPEGSNAINPEYFSLIRCLKSKGIHFVVASGRHKSSVDKLFEPVKDDVFLITSNGSYIGTYNKKLSISNLSPDAYSPILEDLEYELNLPYFVETVHAAYTPSKDPDFFKFVKDGYKIDLHPCNSIHELTDPIIKISAFHPEHISEVDPSWLNKWNKLCRAVICGKHWVDFLPDNTNKGLALSQLQSLFGVTINETVAFGDQVNDVEMLKQAYYSFAVEDANPITKNAARFTCNSCHEDGVLNTLKQIFIEKKEL